MKRDLILLALVATALVAWLAWQARTEVQDSARLDASGLLTADAEDFKRVTGPEPLAFPDDHGLHPGYRNEWWYFTGNLDTDRGPMGFQFTLFRFALDPGPEFDSHWQAEAVWMVHLALSDDATAGFHSSERIARGSAGLAGAEPERWWLRDWQVTAIDNGWRLEAGTESFAIELDMEMTRPIVLQGDDGYSRKGPDPGNASSYYSVTRLASSGRIRIGQEWHKAEGTAWLDREWGSSQLGEDLAGWDWFALQLDDGRDVMVYRLRRHEGTASPFSAGVVVQPDGQTHHLNHDDFTATEQRWWRDEDRHRWPVEWRVDIPAENLALIVEPLFDQQRWSGSIIYWEGAIRVVDAGSGEQVGRGYLELSGYAE